MKIQVKNPEAVVKRAMWLAWQAWQACGGPSGMGVLQNRSGVTEEDVWKNLNAGGLGGDYPRLPKEVIVANPNRPGKVYGDYVFGRKMKTGFEWDDGSVTFRDDLPRRDYQAWCHKYPTTLALVEAAIASLGTTQE